MSRMSMIMILAMLLQQMEMKKGNMITKNDEYESVLLEEQMDVQNGKKTKGLVATWHFR